MKRIVMLLLMVLPVFSVCEAQGRQQQQLLFIPQVFSFFISQIPLDEIKQDLWEWLKSPRYEEEIMRAESYYKTGDYDKALGCLRKPMNDDGEKDYARIYAYFLAAGCYANMGEYDNAYKCLDYIDRYEIGFVTFNKDMIKDIKNRKSIFLRKEIKGMQTKERIFKFLLLIVIAFAGYQYFKKYNVPESQIEVEENEKNSFLKSIKNSFLNNYWQFKGRTRRSDLKQFAIVLAVLYIILAIIGSRALSIFIGLALAAPTAGIVVRRLHDTGKDGRFALIGLVPYVNLFLVSMLAINSKATANEYGESVKYKSLLPIEDKPTEEQVRLTPPPLPTM